MNDLHAQTWISGLALLISMISAFVSISSYRRVSKIKSLDLLIELHKLRKQTDLTLSGLPELIKNATGQRCETASFVGLGGSGWLEAAKDQSKRDLAEVCRLIGKRSSAAGNESKLDAQAVADLLTQEHGVHMAVTRCEERYRTWLTDDLEWSREERARRDASPK